MGKKQGRSRPGTSSPERTETPPRPVSDVLAAALPTLAFALLYAGTFKRWILPFQDGGREIGTAWRLASGERLYTDIGYYYGPLPALLDGLAFKVLGLHLDVLIALRTLVALAGLEALRRLALRITRDAWAAGTVTSLAVGVCFFTFGGTYPFPYSVAALEGTAGTWIAIELALGSTGWRRTLAAAAVAGVAAGTKIEILPAALAGLALGLFFHRPRKETAGAIVLAGALAAASFLGPVAVVGAEQLRRGGYLIARVLPGSWKTLYGDVLWGGGPLSTFPLRLLTTLVVPGLLFLGAGFALSRLLPSDGRLARAGLFLFGLAGLLVPGNREVHLLVPLSVAFLAAEAFRARGGVPPERAATLAVGVAMLPALLRQPFSLIEYTPFTAFSGPLPLLISAAAFVRLAGGSGKALCFVAGLAGAQAVDKVVFFHRVPMRKVEFARGSFYLFDREAALLERSVDALAEHTPPGSWVGVFPESGAVLFFADRKNPFADETFFPGAQDEVAEERMIRCLETRPLAAALVVRRPLIEYGFRLFGEGYLERFRSELERRMTPVERIGRLDVGPAAIPIPARAVGAVLYVPRPEYRTFPSGWK